MLDVRSEANFISVEFNNVNCFKASFSSSVIKDVEKLFSQSSDRPILLSMRNIDHIDSSGYGAILMISRKAYKLNINLAYINFTERALKGLRLIQFDKVLKVFKNEKEAIAGLIGPLSGRA